MIPLLQYFGQYVCKEIEIVQFLFGVIVSGTSYIYKTYFSDNHFLSDLLRITLQQDGTELLNCVDPSSPRYYKFTSFTCMVL